MVKMAHTQQNNPNREIQVLARCGDLGALRHYLEVILPSLPKEDQEHLCVHTSKKCSSVPCLGKLNYLAEDSVIADQLAFFEYLWDEFLSATHVHLSWQMLEWAATNGRIDFAKSFWARDSKCFSILSPYRVRGPPEGESQIMHAVRFSHFEYADYMLAHGADINAASPQWKIVPSIVSWRAEAGLL